MGDLYSDAIIVSMEFREKHPEAVAGLLRALNRSIKDAIADSEAAIASVQEREPMIKPAVERKRFDATLANEMNHPKIAAIGLGDANDAWTAHSIDILVKVIDLPRSPELAKVFDRKFPPPLSDRPPAVQ